MCYTLIYKPLYTGDSQVLAWKTETSGIVSPFFALTTERGLKMSNSGVEAADLGLFASPLLCFVSVTNSMSFELSL